MQTQQHIHRRTHYFVKKEFQLHFILKFCGIIMIGIMVSTAMIYYFTHSTLTSSFEQSRLVIKSTAQSILPSLIYTNLVTLALITLASIVVTLFVSHKIVGPLIRFEKEIIEIGEGDLRKRIRLRKNDQIEDLRDSLNYMTERLHGKVSDIAQKVDELMKSAPGQQVPEGFINAINDIHETIERNFKL